VKEVGQIKVVTWGSRPQKKDLSSSMLLWVVQVVHVITEMAVGLTIAQDYENY
jgi:hypothetical protein